MSFHLIHILNHGSILSVKRGCLICTLPDKSQKKAPLDDIIAVIIAARGIQFSSNALSSLTEKGAVVLHCNESYRPIAQTVRISSIIHKNIFEQQIRANKNFNQHLWNKLLTAKINNQIAILDVISRNHTLRQYIAERETFEEGNTARTYWKYFFSAFGKNSPKTRKYQQAKDPINTKLNYGYAVLGAILHRSIVGHGFNPSLGIHHRYRFKSNPLVYDFIEPLRPFCDAMLFEFVKNNPDGEIKEWAKFIAQGLIKRKITVTQNKKIKFLYGIDYYVSCLASCFYDGNFNKLFIPELTKDFIAKDK